jgi:hypothetical protein
MGGKPSFCFAGFFKEVETEKESKQITGMKQSRKLSACLAFISTFTSTRLNGVTCQTILFFTAVRTSNSTNTKLF